MITTHITVKLLTSVLKLHYIGYCNILAFVSTCTRHLVVVVVPSYACTGWSDYCVPILVCHSITINDYYYDNVRCELIIKSFVININLLANILGLAIEEIVTYQHMISHPHVQ